MTSSTPSTRDRTASKTRVLIVDENAIERVGITALLAIETDIEVCGEAATATEAMRMVAALRPDVVLLDLALDAGNGLDLIKDLRDHRPRVRVLVVTVQDEALYAERCVRAGARGFLSKARAVLEIGEAIRRVRDDAYHLSHAVVAELLRNLGSRDLAKSGPLATLSDRELQVYEGIGYGLSVKEIAAKHQLSPKTIDSYRTTMKRKLGLASSHQLARHAMRWVLERTRPDGSERSQRNASTDEPGTV